MNLRNNAIGLNHPLTRMFFLCLIALITAVAFTRFYTIFQSGNSLTLDSTSEANAIRAAESYVTEGFTKYAGLPNVYYGQNLGAFGFKGFCLKYLSFFPIHTSLMTDISKQCQIAVYTHYPPGPDYLVAGMTWIVGPGKVQLYRLLPVFLGMICLIFFAWALWNSEGPVRATLAMGAFISVPMFTNMMHWLHHQSHAFSLFLVQLAILLIAFQPRQKGKKIWFALGVLGFVQGWFSFDYFFVVSLSAIPFWLLTSQPKNRQALNKLALGIMIPTLCFGFAHFLHFLQLAIFFGGFGYAANELFSIGIERSYGNSQNMPWSALHVLYSYLKNQLSHPMTFKYGYWIVMGLALLTAVLPYKRGKYRPLWIVKIPHYLPALLTSLMVSSLWVFVMHAHAINHRFFHAKHFFLSYFIAVILILRSFNNKQRLIDPHDE